MQFTLQSLGSLDQFKKAAVVTDAGRVESLTEISGKLLPEKQTHVFSTAQEQEAHRWGGGLRLIRS